MEIIIKNENLSFIGDVLEVFNQTLNYLESFNSTRSGFCGINRIEQKAFPTWILKECLVNMLVYGTNLEIEASLDKITFSNTISKVNEENKQIFLENRLAKFKSKGLQDVIDAYYMHKAPIVDKKDDKFSLTIFNLMKF